MIQIFKDPKFNFIGFRFIAYIFSACLVLGGVFGTIQIARGKANLGTDFSGGSVVSLKFKEEQDIGLIRAVLDKADLKETSIQRIADAPGEPKLKVLLRIKKSAIKLGTLSETIDKIFKEGFPGKEFIIDRIEDVGPNVSESLKQKAFLAIFLAMIGITVYIWFRFELRFGVAAAVATFHDVFAIIGVLYFLNKEFTLVTVTAILTLAGYSLTDTVVVFDRIRENLKIKLKESLEDIINSSINEVLNRTVMTAVTTIIVVIALFIWGGEVIHNFSLTLIMGIIVGTYSSIFVASPILLEWQKAVEKKVVQKAK